MHLNEAFACKFIMIVLAYGKNSNISVANLSIIFECRIDKKKTGKKVKYFHFAL
jgi:hypothetical protein